MQNKLLEKNQLVEQINSNKLAFEIHLGLLLGWFDSVEMWFLGANHIVCVDIHNQTSHILITF